MDFSSMSGWDFERYCADCLLKKGFTKAEVTAGSGDHGVDIIAEQNGIRFGIQCKLYQGQIPNKAVQEAYTGASFYDCDVAVIMSNSELTKQAQTEAKKLRVKFWNVLDYMPDSDKKILQNKKIISLDTELSYENFLAECKNQLKAIQSTFSKGPSKRSDWWISDKANQWLLYNVNLTEPIKWYTMVEAVETFLLDIQNSAASYEKSKLLFKKLCFISAVTDSINGITSKFSIERYEIYVQAVCESLDCPLPNICGDAKNAAYKRLIWELIYSFEMYQIAVECVYKLFECFSDAELIRTMNTKSNVWDYQTVACEVKKGCLQELLQYLKSMMSLEEKAIKRIERVAKLNAWKLKEFQATVSIHKSSQDGLEKRYESTRKQFNSLLKRAYKANQGSSDIMTWISDNGSALLETSANTKNTIDFETIFNNKRDPVLIVLANNQSIKNYLICYYYLFRNQAEKKEELLIRIFQEKMNEELKEPERELEIYQGQQTIFGKASKRLGIVDEISKRSKQIKSIQDMYQNGIKEVKKALEKRLDILYEETLSNAEHNGVRGEVEKLI